MEGCKWNGERNRKREMRQKKVKIKVQLRVISIGEAGVKEGRGGKETAREEKG